MNDLNALATLAPYGVAESAPPQACRAALVEAIEVDRRDRQKSRKPGLVLRRKPVLAAMACVVALLAAPFVVDQINDDAPSGVTAAVEFSMVADRVDRAPDPFQLDSGEFLAEYSTVFMAESISPDMAGGKAKPGMSAWLQIQEVEARSWMSSRGELVSKLSPEKIPVEFPTAQDRKNWIAAGRPGIVVGVTIPNASSGDRDRPFALGTETLSYAELRALPEDKKALRSTLEGFAFDGAVGTDGSKLMAVVQPLLSYPISQATRSALFRMLADVPGIEHRADQRDELGRSADAIVWEDTLYRYELLYDPVSGVDLEHRRFIADLKALPEPTAVKVGMLTERRTVVARGVVDSKNELP